MGNVTTEEDSEKSKTSSEHGLGKLGMGYKEDQSEWKNVWPMVKLSAGDSSTLKTSPS
jgi:hypothetical protein